MSRKSKQRSFGKKKFTLKIILFYISAVAFASCLIISLFSVLKFQFKLSSVVSICITITTSLATALLMIFHRSSRCIYFLLIPQIFSKRGRSAVVAFAFILAFSGPTRNILKNVEVLSRSISCGQGQLKIALNNLMIAIKEPYLALQDALTKILPVINKSLNKVRENILEIKRSLNAVGEYCTIENKIVVYVLINFTGRTIGKAFAWLVNIVKLCNKKGTPFDMCLNAFEQTVSSCR